MRGWFCCAIGTTVCGGLGGFPPGGGAFEAVGGVVGADDDIFPLVFLASGSGAADLVVEDIEEVCVGLEEPLVVWVLGGGSMGVGCFPLDTGGVGIGRTSVVESWDFPGSGLALGKGEFAGLGVPGRLESFWIADVTVVLGDLRLELCLRLVLNPLLYPS